jgi:hypothetical protein
MLFPSNGSYQIKATVNGYSLEDCSLIRAEDQIRPYFAVSVAEDPDLTALLVYLRSPQGAVMGEKVRYVVSEDADPPDPVGEEGETPPEEGEGDGDTSLLDLIGQAGPREQWSFTKNRTTEESTDFIIKVRSFDKDLPYFPIPEKLEPGSYILVFEAVGGRNILSRTETEIFYLGYIEFNLKDISVYLPGVSSSRLIPPGGLIMLEAGLNYDSRLDPYVVWYNGKTIISEGRIKDGAGNILRKMPDQAEFYSVRLEVLPLPFKLNLTGYTREITLTVSPKAVNAGYFFTDGPQFAAHHSLAQGTVFPEQLKLSAEAAELSITAAVAATATPATATPATAVAATAAEPVPPTLLQLYQFGGSLHDTVQAETGLTPLFDRPPQWVTVGQSFGLSTGPDDSYLLPPFSFFRETPTPETPGQGGGIFLLHVKPAAEGVIFNAFFPFRSSPLQGVTMEMTATENSVLLRLSTPGENDTILYIYLNPSSRRAYIPVAVEFFFRPSRMEARMSIGEPPLNQSVTGTLRLPITVAGEGKVRLGGVSGFARAVIPEPEKNPPPVTTNTAFFQDEISVENLFPEIAREVSQTGETEPASAADTATPESPAGMEKEVAYSPSVTVWNEFAVLYSELPLLTEEDIITEESENTERPERERVPVNLAVTATVTRIQNPQTEPEETLIEADQDESDSKIFISSEEETRVLADNEEDFPLVADEPESPGESGEDEEDTDDSVAVSGDI